MLGSSQITLSSIKYANMLPAWMDTFTSDKISGKCIAFWEHAEFHSSLTVYHPKQQQLLLSTIPVSRAGEHICKNNTPEKDHFKVKLVHVPCEFMIEQLGYTSIVHIECSKHVFFSLTYRKPKHRFWIYIHMKPPGVCGQRNMNTGLHLDVK